MTIHHKGFIFTLIYTENDNGCLNQSLYSFTNLDTTISYYKKKIKDTIVRLEDICGFKYEVEGEDKVFENHPEYRYASIDCGDGLEYTFEIRKIPLRLNDNYENPDEVNDFNDLDGE